MEHTMIRVLIADDHGVVRAGLRSLLLESGLDVVGEASNGREAIALVDELQPDVVLLDIRMPDLDGLQALAMIKAANPTISVIMLTTYANPQYLARAVTLGAAGYLSKEVEPHRIPRAVKAAAAGDSLLDAGLLKVALGHVSAEIPTIIPEPTELPTERLTDQETTVLKLIAEGLNNTSIANTLSISHSTVKTHIRHIFQKLAVSDRTQAALWAVRYGLA